MAEKLMENNSRNSKIYDKLLVGKKVHLISGSFEFTLLIAKLTDKEEVVRQAFNDYSEWVSPFIHENFQHFVESIKDRQLREAGLTELYYKYFHCFGKNNLRLETFQSVIESFKTYYSNNQNKEALVSSLIRDGSVRSTFLFRSSKRSQFPHLVDMGTT